jgi:hypothetical protein
MIEYLKTGKYRSCFQIILLGILFFAFNYYHFTDSKLKPNLFIWSDAEGYYQYLPYFFLKNDITHMGYAIKLDNGMMLNSFTYGTALLELPFFEITRLYCKVLGIIDDGYSNVSCMSIWIAASTYVFIGLLLLFSILRKWFDKWPSFIAVLTVYLATNLFYYTVFSPGYSHAYSFFILTLFIYTLDKFLKRPNIANTISCAIPIGIGVLIRPTNVFYILLFLLYDVNSFHAFKERIIWIFKEIKYFILIVLIAFLIFLPQMLYWHAVTGKYFLFSYNYYGGGISQSFIYWNKPKLGYVLFGVESGLLIYSPVFFLAFGGLIWMLIKKSYNAIAIAVLFLFILYSNASWWCYTFSCSFGQRAFIEYYPLLIILIAFLLQKIFKIKIALYIITFLLIVFTFTNIRMSQFYYEECCWVRPDWTWSSYKKTLHKTFYLIPQSINLK